MNKLKIGISIGDINGIGPEVILKALASPGVTSLFTPIIYGSAKALAYYKTSAEQDLHIHSVREASQAHAGKANVINCWSESASITPGKPSEEAGRYAIMALEAAVADLKSHQIDALVTAPINKQVMNQAGFAFPGHTEYLAEQLRGDDLMFMVSDELRVGLATNHLPLGEVSKSIRKDLLIAKLNLMNDSLRIDFGIDRPMIAVLGLNPHAGDGGVLGKEEERIIRPAVLECKKKGMMVMGPFPADGFFGSGQYKKFDGILAMYHDQGLVPFKALSFGSGINFTAGLSGVRTSPDHGTAYDIAGQNIADPASLRHALFSAMDIARNRWEYYDMTKNSLVKREKPAYVEEEDEIIEDEN